MLDKIKPVKPKSVLVVSWVVVRLRKYFKAVKIYFVDLETKREI